MYSSAESQDFGLCSESVGLSSGSAYDRNMIEHLKKEKAKIWVTGTAHTS